MVHPQWAQSAKVCFSIAIKKLLRTDLKLTVTFLWWRGRGGNGETGFLGCILHRSVSVCGRLVNVLATDRWKFVTITKRITEKCGFYLDLRQRNPDGIWMYGAFRLSREKSSAPCFQRFLSFYQVTGNHDFFACMALRVWPYNWPTELLCTVKPLPDDECSNVSQRVGLTQVSPVWNTTRRKKSAWARLHSMYR